MMAPDTIDQRPTVLVTGASGLLGRGIMRALAKDGGFHVVGTAFTRATPPLVKCDLTNPTDLDTLIKTIRPHIIIHAAAERRPDYAQRNPEYTRKLNIDTVRHLSHICQSTVTDPTIPFPIYLIYISTDYVFDGTQPPYHPDSTPNPLNLYGETKYHGELAIMTVTSTPPHGIQSLSSGHAAIIRVPILYGPVTSNDESAVTVLIDVVKKAYDVANEHGNTPVPVSRIVDMDHMQSRYPTLVDDVGYGIVQLIRKYLEIPITDHDIHHRESDTVHFRAVTGIFHISSPFRTTKYDLCRSICRVMGIPFPDTVIRPVTEIPDHGVSVSRPMDAQLSTKRIEDLGIIIRYTDFESWYRGSFTKS